MVKLLFLVVTLFIQDPNSGDLVVLHDGHQIVGQTCDEAKKDYLKFLDENHKQMGVVQAAMDCKLWDVSPKDNQNGST